MRQLLQWTGPDTCGRSVRLTRLPAVIAFAFLCCAVLAFFGFLFVQPLGEEYRYHLNIASLRYGCSGDATAIACQPEGDLSVIAWSVQSIKPDHPIFGGGTEMTLSASPPPDFASMSPGRIDTTYRTHRPPLDQIFASTIPKYVWQTSKSHEDAPAAGVALVETWSMKNPAWDHFVLDDVEVDQFVSKFYNNSVLEAFRAMPRGVMRADAFRYCYQLATWPCDLRVAHLYTVWWAVELYPLANACLR
jgi:hypothetical protein